MSFDFSAAEPVTKEFSPRNVQREPNPFTDAVKSIANKTDPKTDKALALAFLLDKPAEGPDGKDDASKAYRKAYRQLGEAGAESGVEPAVSVLKSTDYEPKDAKGKVIPGKLRITFWTGPEIKRPRK